MPVFVSTVAGSPRESPFRDVPPILAGLRRLQTDYLDIWYLHRDFEDGGDEEMLQAMAAPEEVAESLSEGEG